MLERKKEERKLSVGAFFLLFFGVFLAIVDGIVAIVSVVLLSIGQNFRWEMLLLAAGCLMAALAAWLAIRAGLKRNKLLRKRTPVFCIQFQRLDAHTLAASTDG